jgi:hypothetical protein
MGRETAPRPRENPHELTYEEIIWIANSPFKDENLWERNKSLVKYLMEMKGVEVAEVKERAGCAKGDMPTKYKIDDLIVDYQPNWNFYQVNLETAGTLFSLPKDSEVPPERCVSVMLDDIAHIKRRAKRLNT